MDDTALTLGIGVVIILAIFLVAAYVWYYHTGWAGFSFAGVVPYSAGGPSLCGAGASCVAGNCVAPCAGDADCPGGAAGSCTAGLCPPAAGKTCCPGGQQLVGGACLPVCAAGQLCAGVSTCQAGFCQTGVTPSWAAAGGKTAASLRFLRCTFTATDPGGATHSADVTAVLNGMAAAYRGAATAVPAALSLDRPLNAFSFQIPGVNDSTTVSTAEAAAAWANSATTLTGSVRTI